MPLLMMMLSRARLPGDDGAVAEGAWSAAASLRDDASSAADSDSCPKKKDEGSGDLRLPD